MGYPFPQYNITLCLFDTFQLGERFGRALPPYSFPFVIKGPVLLSYIRKQDIINSMIPPSYHIPFTERPPTIPTLSFHLPLRNLKHLIVPYLFTLEICLLSSLRMGLERDMFSTCLLPCTWCSNYCACSTSHDPSNLLTTCPLTLSSH